MGNIRLPDLIWPAKAFHPAQGCFTKKYEKPSAAMLPHQGSVKGSGVREYFESWTEFLKNCAKLLVLKV